MCEGLQMTLVPAELIEQFRRNGFVVVPGLVTADELVRDGAAVDFAVAARKSHDTRAVAEKSRYEQSFIQCINLWEDHPEVRPLTFNTRVAHAAAELVGTPSVRLWHDQALYKEAGGRATDCHQDQPYWPIAETNTVTAWIPLEGSVVASGAMAYVPGSHLVGLQQYVHIFGHEDPPSLLDHPALGGMQPVTVEVATGDVAFHHGLTVHLAHANSSARTRRVHTMIYFADGSTRGSARWHDSVDRVGIGIGELIASDLTPVMWPREPDAPIVQPSAPPELDRLFPEMRGAMPSHLRN
jgi:ectoine hydroxylase-related dioxygenase (phytanoyl-CoA dioxygenase family)